MGELERESIVREMVGDVRVQVSQVHLLAVSGGWTGRLTGGGLRLVNSLNMAQRRRFLNPVCAAQLTREPVK